MTSRVSKRRDKIYVDGIEFKRYCFGLVASISSQFQIEIPLDVMMEMAAKAAGFKSMRDLKLFADRNVVRSPSDSPPQEALAFSSIERSYPPNSTWLREAQHQFGLAFNDAPPSGALALAVLGSTRGSRLAAAASAVQMEDAVMFDMNVFRESELAKIDRTSNRVVVFDRVRKGDGSAIWAIEFARRHREKAVVLLVEEGSASRLVPTNDAKRNAQRGWRLNYLDLDQQPLTWGHVSQAPRSEPPERDQI